MGYFETKYKDYLYAIFRIGIGALFFQVGIMKILGLWGMPGGAAPFGTMMWFAGVGELLIGASLIFGVLVRLSSLFGIIEMIIAYYIGHVSVGGWNPLVNMGQGAILFMLSFMVTFAYGAKKVSLEQKMMKREVF